MMRRLQVVAMTSVILLGLGTLARHVNAYTTSGHAWGVRQVPYHITLTTCTSRNRAPWRQLRARRRRGEVRKRRTCVRRLHHGLVADEQP